MCFVTIALVTDRDAGIEGLEAESVTQSAVFQFFAETPADYVNWSVRSSPTSRRPASFVTCTCGEQ